MGDSIGRRWTGGVNVKREGCPAEWVIVYREEMDRRVGVGGGYIYSPVEREHAVVQLLPQPSTLVDGGPSSVERADFLRGLGARGGGPDGPQRTFCELLWRTDLRIAAPKSPKSPGMRQTLAVP